MATIDGKIEVYFSHSWRSEDVALNLLVWEAICEKCAVSVDKQGRVLKQDSFFVNRLEFLIGQSDAFVSVLPFRDQKDDGGNASREYQLQCSRAALFEIRLAERARKPRLIIYERSTRFRPINTESKLVKYIAVDTKREIVTGGLRILEEASDWLSELNKRRNSGSLPVKNDVTVVVDEENPQATEIQDAIIEGLKGSRFSERRDVRSQHLDSEIIAWLQASDLLVAEVGSMDCSVLGIAHALFTPTIRFIVGQARIPHLLIGHPVGYEKDLIAVDDPKDLSVAIRDRIFSMEQERELLKDRDSGIAYLRRNLNDIHKVFISHNLQGDGARLIEEAINELGRNSIISWEYRQKLEAGTDWKEKLQNAMADTTHVVFIADDRFEQSVACWDELIYFSQTAGLGNGHVFPFLWNGRTKPIAAYAHLDNEELPQDISIATKKIVERLVKEINVRTSFEAEGGDDS
jgi:TIR domain